jgi:6-methylsalicylate decarboxylase
MTGQRIDVHCHYFGGAVNSWFASVDYKPTEGVRFNPWTVQSAIEFMDRHQTATQVLSLPFIIDAETCEDPATVARQINHEYAELIRSYPDRFGAFAALPFHDPDAAVAEICYAIDELGLDGVLLPSNAGGHYFGQPFFEPILAELSGRRTPAFVHPEACPHVEELSFGRSRSIVEFPFDTARNVVNAIFSGVFRRYEGLQLILAHAGGVLPTLGWRISALAGIGASSDPPTAEEIAGVLRGLFYDTALAGGPLSMLPTLQVTGVDHVLFGTDFPAAPISAIVDNTTNLISLEVLSHTDLQGVERTNALALFPRLT